MYRASRAVRESRALIAGATQPTVCTLLWARVQTRCNTQCATSREKQKAPPGVVRVYCTTLRVLHQCINELNAHMLVN